MMNRFLFRMFVKNSTIACRNFTHLVRHNPLKIRVSCDHQKYRSLSRKDLSKLFDCPLTDEFDYEDESPYSKIDFNAITERNPEKLKNLKLLQLEIDLMNQQGAQVPVALTTDHWKELLKMDLKTVRMKFLRHLWLIEMKKRHRRDKLKHKAEKYQELKGNQPQERKILTTSSPIEYHLTRNSLFYRIRDPTINRLYNYKLLLAEWFGPHILVDCSYESFMTQKNLSNCIKQMMFMWAENRDFVNPYDLMFCNVESNNFLWQKFTKIMHTSSDPESFPVNCTNEHYLNLFPKEKLVYLTPHCNEILHEYNHEDIYIIGAFVDANRSEPVSLAKAKKDGIRKAKFPLDKYLHWTMGTKSLTLNQVIAILNDLKDGQPWPEALKHVPRRKTCSPQLDHDPSENFNHLTAKGIRENYRKNLVYDLLMKEKFKSPAEEN